MNEVDLFSEFFAQQDLHYHKSVSDITQLNLDFFKQLFDQNQIYNNTENCEVIK